MMTIQLATQILGLQMAFKLDRQILGLPEVDFLPVFHNGVFVGVFSEEEITQRWGNIPSESDIETGMVVYSANG